jgi:hypothetical protein
VLIHAVVENLGYRQMVDLWRLTGLLDFVRGKNGWGTMTRVGLARDALVEPVSTLRP